MAKNKYDKIVPIEITDSEYEQLKQFFERQPPKNTISSVLTVIAWIIFIGGFIIFIGGFISSIVLARDSYSHTDAVFSFTVALTYWAVSFISGIFILGFAEIIKLLNDIKNK